MTSVRRREEASKVSSLFHAALTSLGFKALAEAIQLWADVSAVPTQVATTSGKWLTYALSLTGKRRRHARDLTFSYFRLVRALETGYTIQPLEGETPTVETLSHLRDDFYEKVDLYAPEVLQGPQDGTQSLPEALEPVPNPEPEYTDEELIELEEIADLEAELARQDAEAEEEARIVLEALGPNNLEAKLKLIDDDLPAKEVDALREKARREAGKRQAAAVERMTLNGGRGALWHLAGADARVLGYVRVSRTGTPCGWCAMLISRGFVRRYRDIRTASFATDDAVNRDEGDLYHDNCHCYAVPIFTEEQFNNDPRFTLNHEYAVLWKEVTEGLDGKQAISAWRKYIRGTD